MSGALKAHRWVGTMIAVAALAGFGYLGRASHVELPLLQDAIPTRLLVIIIAPAVILTPLYRTFPELTTALWREPLLRVARVLAVLALAATAVAPSMTLLGTERFDDVIDTRLYLLLLGLALIAVTAIGDYAWLPVFAAGFGSLMLTAAPANPVTAGLAATPTWAAVTVVVVSAMTYAVRGAPRPSGPRPD